MSTSEKIIKIAKKYINLTECKPNAEWTSNTIKECKTLSSELVTGMKKTGWASGLPYCAAFVEYVVCEALKDDAEKLAKVKKLLTPSVMQSYNGVKNLVTKTPTPGAIFFMQNGNSATGHAGFVGESVKADSFSTVEANTSPSPLTPEQDRNGDGIYSKVRKLNFVHSDGLHLLGFLDLDKI